MTAFGSNALDTPAADEALLALERAGASHVAIVPTWYMRRRSSSSLAARPRRTPSDAGVIRAARVAQSLGLEVAIKPHVDVLDGTFRGEIRPRFASRWFESYAQMLARYAEIAEETGATMLVVGTELESLSEDEARFRALIQLSRDRFSGALTYAANWVDEAERVRFWDALDYVGVDAYMPLSTESREPSVGELQRAWDEYRDRLRVLHERTGLPVLFTELGYESRVGTTMEPYGTTSGRPSERAQARAYEAAFRAFSTLPWFRGIYWWNWPAAQESPAIEATSYSPRGKSAETTLRRWHRRLEVRRGV